MMYLPPILDHVQKLGHAVFTEGEYNLNLIAIRRSDRSDDLAVAYRHLGAWRVDWYSATTEPTTHYLQNPVNRKGAAILALGQYRASHAAALHKGRPAICQVAPVTVHRDNDGDAIPNTKTTPTESGLFGINIHDDRGGSAGCILTEVTTIGHLRRLFEAQARSGHGKRVTLTVIRGAR